MKKLYVLPPITLAHVEAMGFPAFIVSIALLAMVVWLGIGALFAYGKGLSYQPDLFEAVGFGVLFAVLTSIRYLRSRPSDERA